MAQGSPTHTALFCAPKAIPHNGHGGSMPGIYLVGMRDERCLHLRRPLSPLARRLPLFPPVGAWRARRRYEYSGLLGHAMQRRPAQLLFCAPPATARSGLHVRSGARLQPCHGRALGREGMQFPAMPFVRPAHQRAMLTMGDLASPRKNIVRESWVDVPVRPSL